MSHLLNTHKLNTECWFVTGDFNEILSQWDKWEGNPINACRSSKFLSCINQRRFIDLGFKGSLFT